LYNEFMSYRYVAIDAGPDALWTFDDPSPFTDYSGNNRSSSSGATAKHAALVKGVDYSLIFGNATRVGMNAHAVMQRGRESQSFSVGTVFRSIKKDPTNTAIQQVWGNDNGYDGICIAGTVVSFATKYTSTGEAKCTFDIQDNANVRVFAIHTAAKNSLYVDGDLVSEVDITAEQQKDTYLYDGNTITGGASSGPNLLAIGSVAVYRHVVPEDDIDAQLAEATDNMSEFHVASGYGASILAVTEDHTSPYHNRTFSTEEDWKSGQSYGTIVEYEQLAPELRNGISIPGSWVTPYPLPQGVGTMYGVIITWLGQGVTVDTSLDGITWAPVTKGVKISTIPTGFDPTDKMLQVRASFVGSVVDDPAHIDDLSITTYLANTVPAVDGRVVTLTSTSIEHNEDIMNYDHNWGAEMINGTINIAAAGTGSFAPKTIEIWAKKAGAAAFSDNVSPNAQYTNGTTFQAYQVDEWQLRTYVINAGMTGALTFTGTGQIGTVLLYPYAKTAAEVMEAYRAFVGRPVLTLPTQGSIGMTELTDQIDAYDYEWSMESAS
jgi:hypothetical protein